MLKDKDKEKTLKETTRHGWRMGIRVDGGMKARVCVWMHECAHGWMDRCKNGRVHGWICAQTDGWTPRWTRGRKGTWTEARTQWPQPQRILVRPSVRNYFSPSCNHFFCLENSLGHVLSPSRSSDLGSNVTPSERPTPSALAGTALSLLSALWNSQTISSLLKGLPPSLDGSVHKSRDLVQHF